MTRTTKRDKLARIERLVIISEMLLEAYNNVDWNVEQDITLELYNRISDLKDQYEKEEKGHY